MFCSDRVALNKLRDSLNHPANGRSEPGKPLLRLVALWSDLGG